MRNLRRPLDRLEWRFELHDERRRTFDILPERRDVLWRKRAVRAKCDGYDVLPLRIDEDERRSGRFLPVDDKARQYAVAPEPRRCLAPEEIIADFGDEDASALLRGEPRHGDRLVRTLSARVHEEAPAAHCLAGHGNLLPRNYHVGVGRPKNYYFFHDAAILALFAIHFNAQAR